MTKVRVNKPESHDEKGRIDNIIRVLDDATKRIGALESTVKKNSDALQKMQERIAAWEALPAKAGWTEERVKAAFPPFTIRDYQPGAIVSSAIIPNEDVDVGYLVGLINHALSEAQRRAKGIPLTLQLGPNKIHVVTKAQP